MCKTKLHIEMILALLAVLLACAGCSDEQAGEQTIPEGYGQVVLSVSTPDALDTRAVSDSPLWLDGTAAEKAVNSYIILMCNSDDATVMQVLTSPTLRSDYIVKGTYRLTFYCLANFTDAQLDDALGTHDLAAIRAMAGSKLGGDAEATALEAFTAFEARAIHISNTTSLPATGIPMTGKLTATVDIVSSQTATQDTGGNALQIVLWRMMAKMQLSFTNPTAQVIRMQGVEIDPLSNGTAGTRLWQPADLTTAINHSHGDIAIVSNEHVTANGPLTITIPNEETASTMAAGGGTYAMTLYVNETDTSYTALANQLSLRFKVLRAGEFTEYRYGYTTPYVADDASLDGFNVVRRNDWIVIPITFSDWQFRMEALPYPPIAGFQARVASAEALSVTFNTGGYIVLHALFRKSTDAEGVWRTLDDSDITFGSISTTGATGIFEEPLAQIASGDFVGKLTNDPVYGTSTVTMQVTLGGFLYKFNYNITKTD